MAVPEHAKEAGEKLKKYAKLWTSSNAKLCQIVSWKYLIVCMKETIFDMGTWLLTQQCLGK